MQEPPRVQKRKKGPRAREAPGLAVPRVRLYEEGLWLSVRVHWPVGGRPRGLSTDGGAAGTSRRRDRVQVSWRSISGTGGAASLPRGLGLLSAFHQPGEHGITKCTLRGGGRHRAPALTSGSPPGGLLAGRLRGAPGSSQPQFPQEPPTLQGCEAPWQL